MRAWADFGDDGKPALQEVVEISIGDGKCRSARHLLSIWFVQEETLYQEFDDIKLAFPEQDMGDGKLFLTTT